MTGKDPNLYVDSKFTFHYVYIYILLKSCVKLNCFHLHSTMFIFIFKFKSAEWFKLHHLHSTMFIFIYCIFTYPRDTIVHLHSTMFIFISSAIVSKSQQNIDLHSTMFIFICFYVVEEHKKDTIYIPLCLYLYPSLIISCIFAACNTLYCLPAKLKQLFTFLTLVFSLYSSIFIEYSTFVVLPVF